jgi:hypothetical protein
MMPDAFYTDLPTLTDTEIRILLVAYANPDASMSIKDVQHRTGRTRQVYDAIKALELRGLLTRIKCGGLELAWLWHTAYNTIPDSLAPVVTMVDVVVTPEKPKRQSKPKVVKPEKPLSPQQHPAVLAYTEVTRRKPSNMIAEQIVTTVTDIEKWQATVKDYVMRGWNPLNVAGMIRMYSGEMKVTTGRRSITLEIPHAPAADTQRAFERYLQDNE